MFNSFLMLCVCLPEGKTSQIRQISIHHHPPRDTLVWCAAWCLPCPCSRWGGFRAFADVSNCAAEVESQRERWFWNYLPLWIKLYTWLVVLTILKIWKSMGRIIPFLLWKINMFQTTNQLLSISTNAFGGLLICSGHQHLVGGCIPKVSQASWKTIDKAQK